MNYYCFLKNRKKERLFKHNYLQRISHLNNHMAHQFYFPETQGYSLNILWVSATGRVRGVLDVARDTKTNNMYNLKGSG